MRTLLILLMAIFSNKLAAQNSNQPVNINYLPDFQNADKKTQRINTAVNLQETASLNYKRKRVTLFLLVENILGEIFKPEPVVNEYGFHYQANPDFEIEETKGNTGYIKLGITIRL